MLRSRGAGRRRSPGHEAEIEDDDRSGKFCDQAKGAAQIFAGYKIKRWILTVPLHDSREVVEHALKKTAEVIAKNLAYIDPEFQVLVHDRSDFDNNSWKRRAQLRNRIRPVVPLPPMRKSAQSPSVIRI